jgi:bacillithiol biosynthesis cysteine-adding enzyme BshC
MSAPKKSRVITESLGGSSLSRAVQSRVLPAAIQPPLPQSADEWRIHIEQARAAAGGAWFKAIEPALAPDGAAARRIRRVASEGGVLVTTGQQAALFGGPLYTLAKAITAITLADALEKQFGIPTAPVFWGATDDADFLEAATAMVADADGVRALRLETTPPTGAPMSHAPLGDAKALIAGLRSACGSAANAEFFEIASGAFSRERTLGAAYVAMLRELMHPLGMSVLDSSHSAYRAVARPILAEALKRAPDIARALSERAAAIRAAGFEPQVEDDRGLSLVFALEGEHQAKRRIAVTEAAEAVRGTLELSPNVLLRPIVERAILPTVAYVGGPGELAYFAQSNAAAEVLGREPVVGVPRWSCTIVEPFADRALKRLDVDYTELQDVHALEKRLAEAAMPERVATAWKRLQEETQAAVRALGASVTVAKLMPPEVIEGLERSLAHRLSRGERRLLAAVKRKNEDVRKDIAVASGALFPMGKRQERALNFIPMLARGGEELLADMKDAASRHVEALVSPSASSRRAEPAALR